MQDFIYIFLISVILYCAYINSLQEREGFTKNIRGKFRTYMRKIRRKKDSVLKDTTNRMKKFQRKLGL